MKVYELMTILSQMDAGSEVVMCNCVTLDEVANSGPAELDDDKQRYELIRALKEVEPDECRVFLYS